jgi:wyosine [tRNA(Phe)-imidazoG37] synthetase (radical SAM superfamily)
MNKGALEDRYAKMEITKLIEEFSKELLKQEHIKVGVQKNSQHYVIISTQSKLMQVTSRRLMNF